MILQKIVIFDENFRFLMCWNFRRLDDNLIGST